MSRFDAGRWAEAFERSAGTELEPALSLLEMISAGLRPSAAVPSGSRGSRQFDQFLEAVFTRTLPKELQAAGETARRLVALLARRHHLGSLGTVTAAVRARSDRAAGRVLVRVESARPLDEPAQSELRRALTLRTGARELLLAETVDPGLLGGLRIRIGGEMTDGSLRGRLADLAETLDVDVRGASYGQI